MHQPRHFTIHFITLLVTALASSSLLADQGVHTEMNPLTLAWVETTDRDGFTRHVPNADPQQLAERIEQLHTELIAQQQQLAGEVEETRLGAKDAVITAIMPGGLLYAGYRKREHSRASNALAAVSETVDELAHDLAATRGLANAVAQRD